ncbi:CBS domain-containing protein, partial [Shigella sonnei]
VMDARCELTGIVTDGDIRRYVMYNNLFLNNPVTEVMTSSPVWIYEDELVEVAIRKMEQNSPSPVSVLPVLNRNRKVTGIINLADMLKSGFL